jgi:subtilisin family serine protease
MEMLKSFERQEDGSLRRKKYELKQRKAVYEYRGPSVQVGHLEDYDADIDSAVDRTFSLLPDLLLEDHSNRNRIERRNVLILSSDNEEDSEVIAAEHEYVIGLNVSTNSAVTQFEQDFNLQRLYFDTRGSFGIFKSDDLELVTRLENDDRVSYIDPNILDGDANERIEDDAEAGEDIEIPNTLWNHSMLGIDVNGHDNDGDGVVVAVIDGMIDFNHPAIHDSLAIQENSDNLVFGERLRIVEHGMACISIIAGQTTLPNGQKIGVAPSTKVIPIAISTYPYDPYVWRASAIEFIAEIAMRGIYENPTNGEEIIADRIIVNCSWRLRSSQPDLTAVKRAFKKLTDSPALCVCSAGNYNNDEPHLPSEYPGVIRVAALDINSRKNGISSYGTSVTFCAPGGTGTPMDNDDILIATVNQNHTFGMGTSFAAPHISGLLAALWSQHPSFTKNELLEFVKNHNTHSVDDLNPDYSGKLGSLLKL